MQMSQSQRVEKSPADLSGANALPEVPLDRLGLTIALAPASEAWGSAASGLRQTQQEGEGGRWTRNLIPDFSGSVLQIPKVLCSRD